MKMDSTKLKNILKERLKDENRTFKFDSKQDTLRVENVKTGKGITIELPPVLANYENVQEKAIDEIIYYVEEALNVMGGEHSMEGKEKFIFQSSARPPFRWNRKKEIHFYSMSIRLKPGFFMPLI